MPTDSRVATSDEQIDAAIVRGRLFPARRVVEAKYDARADAVTLRFESGTRLEIPRRLLKGLSDATAAQLREIQIGGPGTVVYWPQLDVAHYVPGLLEGVFGTRKWMAELGRRGGAARTPAKIAASRANGAKGGWPKGRPRKATEAIVVGSGKIKSIAEAALTGSSRKVKSYAGAALTSAKRKTAKKAVAPARKR